MILGILVGAFGCGGDDEQQANTDARASIDAPVSIDAAGSTADADTAAPDADPNAPDADLTAPDADLTAPDAAVSMSPDAAVGIDCAGDLCTLGTEECCVVRQGMTTTATCVATGTCTGNTASCDGPEDCMAGEDCCATFSGGPGMGSGGTECTSSCSGFILCNDGGDCPSGQANCCPNPFGPGAVCTNLACP